MYIEQRGSSLLLRWSCEGKSYSFSLKDHNNPIGKSAAKMKLAIIEKDIRSGHFDPTLLRYKPRRTGNNPTSISAIELFEKYIQCQRKDGGVSHGSILRLEAIASKLNRFLGDKLAEKVTTSVAKDTIAQWSESAGNNTIKSYLYYLKDCWDWAKGYHTAEDNPWWVGGECSGHGRD